MYPEFTFSNLLNIPSHTEKAKQKTVKNLITINVARISLHFAQLDCGIYFLRDASAPSMELTRLPF